MAKANRVCYCCGYEYYFCPSCPKDKKDPQIYTMWDSEVCKDIFNTLVSESTKKITTKECKDKLIELGVDKIDIKRDSVKNHINRIMEYKDVVKETKIVTEDEVIETVETTEVDDVVEVEVTETVENETPKATKKKKSSSKSKSKE